jgi:hypothetical protein
MWVPMSPMQPPAPERAGERGVVRQPQVPRGFRGAMKLLDRPLLARIRIAADLRRGESVEQAVVGRMHGDELTLQMRRELGDHQPVPVERRLDVVAIGAAFRCLREVEEPVSSVWTPLYPARRPQAAM